MEERNKSILGIGNALTDILAVLPDDTLLKNYNLPVGSMQHVDEQTGNGIWEALKSVGVEYVPGGSASNTIAGAAMFGMNCGFIGKVSDDELGTLFRQGQEHLGIKPILLKGKSASGRAMVFVTAPNSERTFAVYLGAALELVPEDLNPDFFAGYDYFHIEGYLVQNHALVKRAVELAKEAGSIISIDLASYNVVEENLDFLRGIVSDYVDIVFANETESKAFTGKEPREALEEIAGMCDIAVVKLGPDGSIVKHGESVAVIEPYPANCIDATGAGDMYAAGFLYAHSKGMPTDVCGKVGSMISSKVVEVVGSRIADDCWKEALNSIGAIMESGK